jgi:hypothetical protein
MSAYLERAEMSAAEINDLPDSAFAYIEAGGKKDSEGKTVPRSLRHFPLNDEAHVRNALARAPQSPFGEKAMPKIRAAAKKMGIEMSDPAGRSDQAQPWSDTIMRTLPLDDFAVRTGHATCERCGKNATGRMVDAYAAVFNVSAEIHDQHGRYNEVIDPVAFNRTLKNEIDRVSVYYHQLLRERRRRTRPHPDQRGDDHRPVVLRVDPPVRPTHRPRRPTAAPQGRHAPHGETS